MNRQEAIEKAAKKVVAHAKTQHGLLCRATKCKSIATRFGAITSIGALESMCQLHADMYMTTHTAVSDDDGLIALARALELP